MPLLFGLTEQGTKDLASCIENIKDFTMKTGQEKRYDPQIMALGLIIVATKISVFEHGASIEVLADYLVYAVSLNKEADDVRNQRIAKEVINKAMKDE